MGFFPRAQQPLIDYMSRRPASAWIRQKEIALLVICLDWPIHWVRCKYAAQALAAAQGDTEGDWNALRPSNAHAQPAADECVGNQYDSIGANRCDVAIRGVHLLPVCCSAPNVRDSWRTRASDITASPGAATTPRLIESSRLETAADRSRRRSNADVQQLTRGWKSSLKTQCARVAGTTDGTVSCADFS